MFSKLVNLKPISAIQISEKIKGCLPRYRKVNIDLEPEGSGGGLKNSLGLPP